MDMRKIAFIFFMVCCISMNPSCNFISLSPEDVVVHNPFSSFDCCLRVKDSTTIRIDLVSSPTNPQYQWETSIGTIEGQGNQVTYIAADSAGTSRVHLRVLSGNSVVYEKYFAIFVYKQVVLLKADDLKYFISDILPPQWDRFIGYIKSKNIVAGLGLIGYSLVEGSPSYSATVASLQRSGNFEIWNHGYTHELQGQFDEFQNTTYDFQMNHLLLTQNLAKEKLDITLHAFGAPGDYIDSNTTKVIDAVDDITVWFNGDPHSKKVVLSVGGCYIESPIFHPNYPDFVSAYSPDSGRYLFQFHPYEWDDNGFENFQRIIEYLMQAGVTFVTPTQYYESFSSKTIVRATG